MRISKPNAYVMAADPAYFTESVLAYYDYVGKIFVSYDRNHIGWLGGSVPVEACLEQLRRLDRDNKIHYLPGDFYRPGQTGVEGETYQRQTTLDIASEGVDWVLQLDSDEVMVDPAAFFRCLDSADENGYTGMNYPARYLYTDAGPDHYLEFSTRFWRPVANYPGPLAIKAGTKLKFCRQINDTPFHVDIRPRSSDPSRPKTTPVNFVVSEESAVWHFSSVRSEEWMLKRVQWHTHAKDFDWTPTVRHWFWTKHHPYLSVATAPFRKFAPRRLRVVKIQLPGHLTCVAEPQPQANHALSAKV